MLYDYLKQFDNAAVAFSGGVDSAYLLFAAAKCIPKVEAFFIKTAFQPDFEFNDAKRVCDYLGVKLNEIKFDILKNEKVCSNPENRCYYCKKEIFSHIISAAESMGFTNFFDGTNADDDITDRPGYIALQEMGIISPLKICSVTKADIRRLAKENGIDVWDKPSYACIATRIPHGTHISDEILNITQHAENKLFDMGFRDFRIRYRDGSAVIQIKKDDFDKLLSRRENIYNELSSYYNGVFLDLKAR